MNNNKNKGTYINFETKDIYEKDISDEELNINNIVKENTIKNNKNDKFNKYKEKYLKNFRSLQSDIATGLASGLTNEEINWYNIIKNFDYLNMDLPEVPERIKNII